MLILEVVQIVLLACFYVCVGYLLVLTALAATVRLRGVFTSRSLRRFALVIPAHNEGEGIARTVHNLRALEYPDGLSEVVVVADNCTDTTANAARTAGARVLEREDSRLRGKGYALRWCFDRLLGEDPGFDAFVVIDADSTASPNVLKVMNWYLDAGSRVLQVSDLVSPSVDSWSAQMTRIGFYLYNYVRPLGRRALGGSAGLRGNGMCFSASILRQYPWDAFTVGEDLEYGLRLLHEGISVRFAPEAQVLAIMPIDPRNAESQRARWEGSRWGLMRRHALPLLRGAIARMSVAKLDGFLDLVIPPLVTLMTVASAMFLLTTVLAVFGVEEMLLMSALWMGVLLLGTSHLLAGLQIAGADRSVYLALAHVPRYAFWKLSVYVRMLGRWEKDEWVRTTREPSTDTRTGIPRSGEQ